MQDGRGIYKFRNGDTYEGQYVMGERTGEGTFRFAMVIPMWALSSMVNKVGKEHFSGKV